MPLHVFTQTTSFFKLLLSFYFPTSFSFTLTVSSPALPIFTAPHVYLTLPFFSPRRISHISISHIHPLHLNGSNLISHSTHPPTHAPAHPSTHLRHATLQPILPPRPPLQALSKLCPRPPQPASSMEVSLAAAVTKALTGNQYSVTPHRHETNGRAEVDGRQTGITDREIKLKLLKDRQDAGRKVID